MTCPTREIKKAFKCPSIRSTATIRRTRPNHTRIDTCTHVTAMSLPLRISNMSQTGNVHTISTAAASPHLWQTLSRTQLGPQATLITFLWLSPVVQAATTRTSTLCRTITVAQELAISVGRVRAAAIPLRGRRWLKTSYGHGKWSKRKKRAGKCKICKKSLRISRELQGCVRVFICLYRLRVDVSGVLESASNNFVWKMHLRILQFSVFFVGERLRVYVVLLRLDEIFAHDTFIESFVCV